MSDQPGSPGFPFSLLWFALPACLLACYLSGRLPITRHLIQHDQHDSILTAFLLTLDSVIRLGNLINKPINIYLSLPCHTTHCHTSGHGQSRVRPSTWCFCCACMPNYTPLPRRKCFLPAAPTVSCLVCRLATVGCRLCSATSFGFCRK